MSNITEIKVCAQAELPEGSMRLVEAEGTKIGVFNCGGQIFAIEDRCSHDDGPLAEGELNPEECTVECPRHGSVFCLRTGEPRTLPAYEPVETYPVELRDGNVILEVE